MRIIFILLFNCFLFTTQAQSYFQQKVDVNIAVTLDPQKNSLDGHIKMRYHNNSNDTLHYIWFHLWPNAYKNDRTAFTKQSVENGNAKFYFSKPEEKGSITRLQFTVDEAQAQLEAHPQHEDIAKLILPTPLPPHTSIEISTPFYVQLPAYFSRLGYINEDFYISQWFPKPAVYDNKGWHEMPYWDYGEFYSEFGDYEVTINAPEEYIIAAPGNKIKNDITSYTYQLNDVHDFAWFASKEFNIIHDTLNHQGQKIELYIYNHKQSKYNWDNSMSIVKSSVRKLNDWVGTYPYPTLTVVEKPHINDGGMEYPAICLVSKNDRDLLFHEIAHNWFYGILANNERDHAWMDEGFVTYYEKRFSELNDTIITSTKRFENKFPKNVEERLLQHSINTKQDQPINTTSEKFSFLNYALINYNKAANWIELLEREIGQENFDNVMRSYFQQYAFKHPSPEDFKNTYLAVAGDDKAYLFDLLEKKGALTYNSSNKKTMITDFFDLNDNNKDHTIGIFPAVGFNGYDGLMLGAGVHNYSIPIPKFRFIAVPLFGLKSKSFNGIGNFEYKHYFDNGNNISISLGVSRFNKDVYKDPTGINNYLHFTKIAPGIRYTFKKPNPRSSLNLYAQYKYFHIEEKELFVKRDPSTGDLNIQYPIHTSQIHQFILNAENNRTLYHHNGKLQVDLGDGFVRTALEGNYFFHYNAKEGLNIRLFAGKFFYTKTKTPLLQFETSRYHLNMTGANGYEDYTYQNYFIERNAFDGWTSQQIVRRDGNFKIKTDLLSDKVGQSDDWLTTINLTTDIPYKLNPLNVLPIKIPLKLFADFGTNAKLWDRTNTSNKILFDAGVQLDVLKTISIYVPIIYSDVYKDYIKTMYPKKKLLRTITFSINIQDLKPSKYIPQFQF